MGCGKLVSPVMGITGDQGHIEADKAAYVHSLLVSETKHTSQMHIVNKKNNAS
jgi:hypothetical protein